MLVFTVVELWNVMEIVDIGVFEVGVVEQLVVGTVADDPRVGVLEPAGLDRGIALILGVGPTKTEAATFVVSEEVGLGLEIRELVELLTVIETGTSNNLALERKCMAAFTHLTRSIGSLLGNNIGRERL